MTFGNIQFYLLDSQIVILLRSSCKIRQPCSASSERTSDGGNGNYGVSLPIILI